jgi:hypothetical protein
VDDLLEIPTTTIEKSVYDPLWNLEMTRVSVVTLPFSILDIDDPYEPIILSLHISIYTTLHPDEVVSIWLFSASVYCSIFCPCSELLERRRHIWDSGRDFMI